MLKELLDHDATIMTLPMPGGAVLVSPGLQGRIFCQIGGELIHRLDAERMRDPVPGEFNNLGGNSLWPAPEGGPFAFNYLPGSDEWLVQDGIAAQPYLPAGQGDGRVAIEKNLSLTNRKGVELDLCARREVAQADPDPVPPGAEAVAYTVRDTFTPLGTFAAEEALIAPWSLEQFPGSRAVTAFCKVDRPKDAVNYDFYGMPDAEADRGTNWFALPLGSEKRFQIGIKRAHHPRLLGAIDMERGLLLIRTTAPQEGRYFNIADNDQPDGPWSAADMYSVFSGADELDFFELETIAPANITEEGKLGEAVLESKTTLCRGDAEALRTFLEEHYGVKAGG